MAETNFQKQINKIYKKLQEEMVVFESEYDNPIMVDSGNLDGEDTKRDEWGRWLYKWLLDELKYLEKAQANCKSLIELIESTKQDFIKKEQYELAKIILKWQKKLV